MKNSKNIYFAILCGGSGTRLWPLSTKKRPKQFVPFLNNKTLLEQTVERIEPLTNNKNQICLISTEKQEDLIKKTVGNKIGFIVKEPVPRNTGPALLYACLEIAKQDPNAVVAFMHSDAFIPDEENFRKHLTIALKHAQDNNVIVTLGIMPTRPATGYGYIQASESKNITCKNVYPVKNFHEKPDLKTAEKYISQQDMFWNPGLFIGKVSVFSEEFKNLSQEVYKSVTNFSQTNNEYEKTPSISFDHAIMEKTKRAVVMPCDFEWNDVGNLDVFLSLKEKYEGINSQILNIESSNNVVSVKNKLITLIGVKNLCIVEENGILVVAQRNKTEQVKNVLALLNKKGESNETFK